MNLSRKRRKELDALRNDAENLWEDQQKLVRRANTLAREARRQAGNYTQEQVLPKVRDGYDQYVRSGVERGSSTLRTLGNAVATKVVPAIGGAVGAAMSVLDVAGETRVAAAIKREKVQAVKAKKSGFGKTLAVGAGLLALAGVGYALWQTFRADDELWVADTDTDFDGLDDSGDVAR